MLTCLGNSLGIALSIVVVAGRNCVADTSCAGVPDNSLLLQTSSSARPAAVQKRAEAKVVATKVKVLAEVANAGTAKAIASASEAKAQQGSKDLSALQKRLSKQELWREARAQLQELKHEVALAHWFDEARSHAQDANAVHKQITTESEPEPSVSSATQVADPALEQNFIDVVKASAELIGVQAMEESKPNEQKDNDNEGNQKKQREAQQNTVRANRKAAQDAKDVATRIAQEKRTKAKQEMDEQHQVARQKREATFKSLQEAKEAKAKLAAQHRDAQLQAQQKLAVEKTRKAEEKKAAKAAKYEADAETKRRLRVEKALKETPRQSK